MATDTNLEIDIDKLVPIDSPLAWTGSQLAQSTDWIVELEPADAEELGDALEDVRQTPILSIRKSDFALPRFGAKLEAALEQVHYGRGFVLLRGIDVSDLDIEQAARLYWGLGCWLGEPISQNPQGHLLGHVRDVGARADNPNQRGYQSSDPLPFHSDVGADMVSLFCLKPARSGGASSVVSGVAIYNEMARQCPELLAELLQPMCWDRRGEVPPGKQDWYELPVFSHHQGNLITAFVRRFILSAQRFEEVPRLTQQQTLALETMANLASDPKFYLSMDFRPGDIQLVNNLAILHSRTGYEDFDEPHLRRHLLRLWLAAPSGWPLPKAFFERYPMRTASGRPAGIAVEGTALKASIDPLAA